MTDNTPENPSATTAAPPVPVASPSVCADPAPGSHVEAACEGPTADNPSLSIKKRLKRAQFFDQREMLVAAGEAVPVESDAGLPEAGIEEGFDLPAEEDAAAGDRPAH